MTSCATSWLPDLQATAVRIRATAVADSSACLPFPASALGAVRFGSRIRRLGCRTSNCMLRCCPTRPRDFSGFGRRRKRVHR